MSVVPVARAGADLRLLRAAMFAAVCVVLSGGGHALASCTSVPLWALGTGFLAVFAVAAPLAGRERSLPGIAAGLAAAQVALHALFEFAQRCPSAGAVQQAMGQAMGHVGTGARPSPGPSDGTLIALAARLVCNEGPLRMNAAEARRVVSAAGIDPAGHLAQTAQHTAGHTAGHTAQQVAPHAWHAQAASLLPSLPMLLGHLLAAVALGLLLRRGEAALFRLVRLSAREVAEGALVRALRAALTFVRVLRAGLLPGAAAAGVRGTRAYGHGTAPPRSLVLAHSVIRRGPPAFGLAA